jgi:hypothetical protein
MNFEVYGSFQTKEQGIEKLKQAVEIRDKMGGAMYFNMLNDDCCEIANRLTAMGADKKEIGNIIGKDNYQ